MSAPYFAYIISIFVMIGVAGYWATWYDKNHQHENAD